MKVNLQLKIRKNNSVCFCWCFTFGKQHQSKRVKNHLLFQCVYHWHQQIHSEENELIQWTKTAFKATKKTIFTARATGWHTANNMVSKELQGGGLTGHLIICPRSRGVKMSLSNVSPSYSMNAAVIRAGRHSALFSSPGFYKKCNFGGVRIRQWSSPDPFCRVVSFTLCPGLSHAVSKRLQLSRHSQADGNAEDISHNAAVTINCNGHDISKHPRFFFFSSQVDP